MDKDFSLMNNLKDQSTRMRRRVKEAIKGLREEGDEIKQPQAKTLPFIPVTGTDAKSVNKYYDNKLKD